MSDLNELEIAQTFYVSFFGHAPNLVKKTIRLFLGHLSCFCPKNCGIKPDTLCSLCGHNNLPGDLAGPFTLFAVHDPGVCVTATSEC